MKREITFQKDSTGSITQIVNEQDIHNMLNLWLQTIPKGEWALKLEKVKKQRSLGQNALLWVWMEVLSKEWAEATDQHYTKEQFKEMFARKFLPVDSPVGVVGRSTSSLTQDEMTEFLTKIQAFAASEWGITLLNAEDKMFNDWRGMYEE